MSGAGRKVLQVRLLAIATSLFLFSGCGVESVGTAAVAAKLQADQAKQAKENLDAIKKDIDTATTAAEQSRKKAEEAAGG